jgi:hypothetical protein
MCLYFSFNISVRYQMGENDYKKALESAEKELAKLEAQAEVIAQRRARLQQTVGALKTLMNVSEQEERTLTDTIRIVVKAANDYISAGSVLSGVLGMGAKFGGKNALASVVTILSRLHKDGELDKEPIVGGRYKWKRFTEIDHTELGRKVAKEGTVLTEHFSKKK